MRKQLGAMSPFALLECQEGHVPAPSSQPLSHGASLGTWVGFWRVPETQAIDFIDSTPCLCFFTQFLGSGGCTPAAHGPIWLATMLV